MTTITQAQPTASPYRLMRTVTLGVIVGNRGFFPSHLAESGRKSILAAPPPADMLPFDEFQQWRGETVSETIYC